ncbi:MAG: hypothetical protein JSS24_04150 [Proteobacteria bacterium]|nr:hypothetical protein [Pseudomonadota bacterium]
MRLLLELGIESSRNAMTHETATGLANLPFQPGFVPGDDEFVPDEGFPSSKLAAHALI